MIKFIAGLLAAAAIIALPRAASAHPEASSIELTASQAITAPLRVSVSTSTPRQGDVLIVRVKSAPGYELSGALGETPVHFSANRSLGPGNYIALIGIDGLRKPGPAGLSVVARLPGADLVGDDAPMAASLPITIATGRYVTESVKLKPALGYTLDPKTNDDEKHVFDAFYAGFTSDQYWIGPFVLPTKGRIVAGYGGRRIYNGINLGSYHSGADISAVKGTPVLAAGSGKVVRVQDFPIRGTAIVIDHGRGVFSSYFHLSKALVSEGQMVKAGQRIGAVGSTGRSEGNHIHFELAVGGAPVEPLYWTRVALP